jgi:hypothetical protein
VLDAEPVRQMMKGIQPMTKKEGDSDPPYDLGLPPPLEKKEGVL